MNSYRHGLAAVLLIGSAIMSFAPTAQAGDVSQASLGCYVDTTAYDQLTSDYCASGWTPAQPNPTTAHFEVVGLTTGNYSFSWSNSLCGSADYCIRSIKKDTSAGGVPITLTLTIYDNDTGASKAVSATAEYIDVYN